jgi:DNA-binding IclR family transcriptional regulator
MTREPHEVKTTRKSLRVIEALQELDGGRVTEVADHVGMAKSTAHKHLTTLERSGYLDKDGDTYHVGLRFLNLGEYARSRWPAADLIKESISELSRRTDEEIDFVAEDHGRVLTVFESYHKWVKYDRGDREGDGTRYRAQIGTYYYSHATASGKAILTEYFRERVERIIDQWGLPPKTENTITDREALFEELERIDRRGYAIDDEEYTHGLRSVGEAVTDPAGDVLGALSVSGPAYRVNGSVLDEEIPRALSEVVADLEADIDAAGAY